MSLSERHLHTDAYVLNRTLQGENRERLSLLSLDCGLITALAPLGTGSRKKLREVPSSLDKGTFTLRRIGSRDLFFVQEFSIIKRPDTLARNYQAFTAAAELARFVELNAKHLPELAPVYDVFERSLDALCAGYSPSVILLKAQFKVARDEGYPVRESWLQALPPLEQALAVNYIGLPLKDLPVDEALAHGLLRKLCLWLLSETDLQVDQRYLTDAR